MACAWYALYHWLTSAGETVPPDSMILCFYDCNLILVDDDVEKALQFINGPKGLIYVLVENGDHSLLYLQSVRT